VTYQLLARLLRPLVAIAALLSFLAWPGSGHAQGNVGAVYALSNSPAGNAVLAWDRAADGTLTPAGSYPAGGSGTGASLSSQGALIITENGQWLFAVNAGSSTIAAFRVAPNGLVRTDVEPSGGSTPTSLTVHGDVLYALNAGDTGTISGFRVNNAGDLSPIPGSTRPLSGNATAPAQVSFSPDGDTLVVTERATHRIDVYIVDAAGLASGPMVYPSSGTTPFGFAFAGRDTLIVSEATQGGPGFSAASSYILGKDTSLTTVTASASTPQGAACWVVVTGNGQFAYTANAGGRSISAFGVGQDGSLTLLNPDGVAAAASAGTTDMALSRNSQFLYVRNAGNATTPATIGAYAVASDGSLTPIAGASGLPLGTAGLAAR
jgi:6-phosphogluconolactonase